MKIRAPKVQRPTSYTYSLYLGLSYPDYFHVFSVSPRADEFGKIESDENEGGNMLFRNNERIDVKFQNSIGCIYL